MRTAAAISCALILLAGAPLCADETVTTIDGTVLAGALVSIDARQVVLRVGETAETLERADVAAVRVGDAPAPDLMATPGAEVLVARDGSRLAVLAPSIADGKLAAANDLVGRFQAPLERVARLLRPAASERPADLELKARALGASPDARDCVVIAGKAERWVPVSGVLKSLQGPRLRFLYEDTEAVLDASTVPVIQMARVGAEPPPPAGLLVAADGSRLVFTALELAGGRATATSPLLGTVRLSADRIAEIRFESDRLTYLSDLEPIQVRETGYLGDTFPYRKDRAADGGPIRLGGVTYEKGLGLHSRCELTYDLGGRFRRFIARAGVDDGAPFGSAHLAVTGDGKTLLERTRLDRREGPTTIRLDTSGVKHLKILVDFGDGTFGAGERVSLADARLLK